MSLPKTMLEVVATLDLFVRVTLKSGHVVIGTVEETPDHERVLCLATQIKPTRLAYIDTDEIAVIDWECAA